MVTYEFSGKTAIVTGGARGIGAAVAAKLHEAGANVCVWDLAQPTRAPWTNAVVDVTKPNEIDRGLDHALTLSGQIDILFNNAGITGGSAPLEAFDPKQWRRVIEVSLISVYEVCRKVVPRMRAAGQGRIVNMASLAGMEGTPNLSAYSAAKAGVIALTKSLGKELAMTGVRVNCIAPAAIETEILAQMSPETVGAMVAKSPMGRLGTVHEVADLFLWLCSDACSFNTGAVFDLSGGRATY
jgi:NAD(P)-dependent dehydrogenase (short-subunit alcohol dehydrogenase family)